ncbi:cobaltochelatase subunit CobN [Vibrio olivae]
MLEPWAVNLEYLWGWQVTNPTLVGDWAWQEVKEVYMDDRYQLGLDDFLEQGHNVHVKSNMLAIMLVAIHKGFWNADQATTQQLADAFAQLVIKHGLPGSGHTTPDHPMMPWLKSLLSGDKRQAFTEVLQQAQQDSPQRQEIHSLKEVKLEQESQQPQSTQSDSQPSEPSASWLTWLISGVIGLFFVAIVMLSYRQHRRTINTLKGAS